MRTNCLIENCNDLPLKVGVWNVNSWTNNNNDFRDEILLNLDFDVLGIVETKLKENNNIFLDNYTWIGHN